MILPQTPFTAAKRSYHEGSVPRVPTPSFLTRKLLVSGGKSAGGGVHWCEEAGTGWPEVTGVWRNWQDERIREQCSVGNCFQRQAAICMFNYSNQIPTELKKTTHFFHEITRTNIFSASEGMWPRPLADIISIICGSVN